MIFHYHRSCLAAKESRGKAKTAEISEIVSNVKERNAVNRARIPAREITENQKLRNQGETDPFVW